MKITSKPCCKGKSTVAIEMLRQQTFTSSAFPTFILHGNLLIFVFQGGGGGGGEYNQVTTLPSLLNTTTKFSYGTPLVASY